jgi:hypothetical protein
MPVLPGAAFGPQGLNRTSSSDRIRKWSAIRLDPDLYNMMRSDLVVFALK